MKIKALMLTLIVILSVFCTFGCSNDREYDEAEVIAAATDLIKKSEILNEIYYGYGIEYEHNESEANGYYYPADELSLKRFGVKNIEDIKTLTTECYTASLSASIISTKLSSVSDEDGILGYARYYQKKDGSEECIMVYKDAAVYLTDEVIYDYSTLSVSHAEGEEVFVKISATVKSAESGETQTRQIEISLLEEESGWRINSPTYLKYVDLDYYDDLQNN